MDNVRPRHKEVREMADTPWYQLGPSDERWPPGTEPTRATPIGPVDETPMTIYLGSRAMEKIDSRLEHAPDTPFAGLLVGHPLSSPDRRFLLVTDVLPFALPPEDEGEVRFSPQLFDELYADWQQRAEGGYIVGWCHAAPKRGIALSSFHRFSHHRYFPRPWQVALIIDSDRRTSLLYHWKGPELVPCDAFYYWNMEAEPAALLFEPPVLAYEAANAHESARRRPAFDRSQGNRKSVPWWVWLLLLLFVFSLIPWAPGSISWMRRQVGEQSDRLIHLQEGLDQLESEQESLRRQGGSAAPGPGGATAAAGAGGSPADSTAAPPAGAASPTPVSATLLTPGAAPTAEPAAESAGSRADPGRDYVIQPGDTMWSISRTLLGDPQEFRRLAEINDIEDPDTIYPGQRLVLPDQ